MSTFYNGSRIEVIGTAPSDSGILIVFRSPEQDEFFNCKGRKGFVWLNADRVHVQRAPSLFLTFGSARSDDLLDRASLDRYLLDQDALTTRIRCLRHCRCNRTGSPASQDGSRDQLPDPAYAKMLLASFFALKEHEGNYAVHPEAVHLEQGSGETKYSLRFAWPKSALPGRYRVEAYACRNRSIIGRSATELAVAEIGFPAYMASLSLQHRWLYGFGAVLAAMLAGFGIDACTSLLRRKDRSSPRKDAGAPPSKTGSVPTTDAAAEHVIESRH